MLSSKSVRGQIHGDVSQNARRAVVSILLVLVLKNTIVNTK